MITAKPGMLATLAAAAVLTLAGCEQPAMETVQRGYRGTGMEEVINPRLLEDKLASISIPEAPPPVPEGGPMAGEVYENVEVLGDLSVGQFTRLMTSITEWVAPEQGCVYCHEGNDFASEKPYTKRVARAMLAMTQRINAGYGDHVGATGVTCYTCHRGQAVPQYTWVRDPGQPHARGLARAHQNIAAESVAYASLPYDPFTPFLEADAEIRVQSGSALPTGNRKSIKQTEWTYALMMHFSDALGVNCTYCHNSRAFSEWEQSSPARVTAWHGIDMVQELNNRYIAKTADDLPDNRKGPLGDPLKVGCDTCHQGAYKPLYGARMLKDFPALAELHGAAEQLYPAVTQ